MKQIVIDTFQEVQFPDELKSIIEYHIDSGDISSYQAVELLKEWAKTRNTPIPKLIIDLGFSKEITKVRRETDYGDFTEYQVRTMIADYCRSVTLGLTGWGVPFKVWVELQGIAKHDKNFRLIRIKEKNTDEYV